MIKKIERIFEMWSIKELDCKKKKREEDNTIELVTFLSNFYLSGES